MFSLLFVHYNIFCVVDWSPLRLADLAKIRLEESLIIQRLNSCIHTKKVLGKNNDLKNS